MARRRVVITGLGCVSPNGNGREAFFEALSAGRSGIRRIEAFATEQLSCRIAAFVRDFDAEAWVTGKDRQHVSRAVALGLAAATEALNDAGLDAPTLSLAERRRFGVLLGSGGGGIEFLERQYGHFFHQEHHKASVYAIPSNTLGTLSSELSMRFGLKGLSHVISTGCTSSTDALGYVFHHIQAGRLDRVLCGGVDAPITPATMAGFCLMRVLTASSNDTPERGSRPFSRDRDGFVLGEGAWLMVLESREMAMARGAKIYAELRGYGATCDAYHRVRLEENGEEPARAIEMALADAELPPDAVDYMNLHGTSTQLNDRIETRAVRLSMGRQADKLAASSTKSMIGHPQGASGAAGVAASLLALTRNILPPTLNLLEPDPECDLDFVPDVGRRAEPEFAVCNCIGFGSKNSALVLAREGAV
jgi:3-oxoacyl-[acyl-carrier-protein] synthase II